MLGELDKVSGFIEFMSYLVGTREGQDNKYILKDFKDKITGDKSSVG